jgi:DNA-binding response OmpR family regulator
VGPKRVLIVDDIQLIRNILSSFVRAENLEAIEAAGGAEALRILETEPVDLVFLDIMMPDVDGMMVLERIRRKKSPSELPVVIASALDEKADVEDALVRGANDYIVKPFTRAIIKDKLDRFLASAPGGAPPPTERMKRPQIDTESTR